MKIKNYPVITKRNVDNHRDQIMGSWGTRSVYLWPQLSSLWVCYTHALMLAGGCGSDAASFQTEIRNWLFSEIFIHNVPILSTYWWIFQHQGTGLGRYVNCLSLPNSFPSSFRECSPPPPICVCVCSKSIEELFVFKPSKAFYVKLSKEARKQRTLAGQRTEGHCQWGWVQAGPCFETTIWDHG